MTISAEAYRILEKNSSLRRMHLTHQRNILLYFLAISWCALMVFGGTIPHYSWLNVGNKNHSLPTECHQNGDPADDSNSLGVMCAVNEETYEFEGGMQRKRRSVSGGTPGGWCNRSTTDSPVVRSHHHRVFMMLDSNFFPHFDFSIPLRI